MQSLELYLGGFRMHLGFSRRMPRELPDSCFARVREPLIFPDSDLHVEIVQKPLPREELRRWSAREKVVDTSSTWAMTRTDFDGFAYHMTPSPSAEYHEDSLHLLASEDFRRMRVYYGQWKNKSPERWLFY